MSVKRIIITDGMRQCKFEVVLGYREKELRKITNAADLKKLT